MPKARQSAEEKALQYFADAPLPTAKAMLNLAKGVVRKRETTETVTGGERPRKPRGTNASPTQHEAQVT